LEFLYVLLWVFVEGVTAAGTTDVKRLTFECHGNPSQPAADGAFLALTLPAEALAFLVAGDEIALVVDFLARRLGLVPVVEADSVAGDVHRDLLSLLPVVVGSFED